MIERNHTDKGRWRVQKTSNEGLDGDHIRTYSVNILDEKQKAEAQVENAYILPREVHHVKTHCEHPFDEPPTCEQPQQTKKPKALIFWQQEQKFL